MLSANLFRALPPSRGSDQENYDPDEEEPTLEPTWPHLQVRECEKGCWVHRHAVKPRTGGHASHPCITAQSLLH